MPVQPRVAVTQRLREITRPSAVSEGLRIAPRNPVLAREGGESAESAPKLVIREHGKEVVRLEAETLAPFVDRQEQLPVMRPRGARSANPEANLVAGWGKSARHSSKWILWSVVAVAALVLAGLLVQPMLEKKDGRAESNPLSSLRVVEDMVNPEDPLVFFGENPAQVVSEIHQAMATYARARRLEEAMPVIRHGEALKKSLSKAWKSWEVPADWEISESDMIGYDSVGKLPYAVISGTRPDFSRYQVFLVREGGRMLVDWEASEGLCTHGFEQLNNPALTAAEVRVEASPVAYYTMAFPEQRHRAFRLVLGASENFLWGYVVRGSAADLAMEEIFMEKRQFSDKPGSCKVRLRLSRGEAGAMANQWLILDVLHKGWVTP